MERFTTGAAMYERFGIEEHPLFKADSLGEFMRPAVGITGSFADYGGYMTCKPSVVRLVLNE